MKKIGILTLNGYHNYGNRLQNYAMQEVLKSLGFNVETIINDRKMIKKEKLTKRMYNLIKNSISEIYMKTYNKIWRNIRKDTIIKRTETFKKFTYDYIKETDYTISKNNIPDDLSDRYDYFITGSDQVWNPDNLHGTSFFFLTFAPKHKRIAYAPSFGLYGIQQMHNIYIQFLAELGLIGTSIFMVLIIVNYLITYKLLKKSCLSYNKDAKLMIGTSFYIQNFWLIYGFFGNPFTEHIFLLTYLVFLSIPFYYRRVYAVDKSFVRNKI